MTTSKILLVDDEKPILNALKRVLRTKGYDIRMATSGGQALELLAQEPVNLIISDMRMPKMNGAEFLSLARQRHPHCKRILLTGYADMDCTVQAINDGGIFGYLSKPWDTRQLLQLIESALHSNREELKRNHLLVGIKKENLKLKRCIEHQSREMATSEHYVEETCKSLQNLHSFTEHAMLHLLDLKQRGQKEITMKVVEITTAMADQLCMEANRADLLKQAAKLYSIGKIGIAEPLLSIPQQALTLEQREAFLCYPMHSKNVLEGLGDYDKVASIIINHKSYLDGSGTALQEELEATQELYKILMLAVDYVETSYGLVTGHHEQHDTVIKLLQTHSQRYGERLIAILSTLTMQVNSLDTKTNIMVPVSSLMPDMILKKDLLAANGTLLLRKGTVLNHAIIQQLHRIQANMGDRLILNVRFNQQDECQAPQAKENLKKAG